MEHDSNMGIKIRFEERDGYLYANFCGKREGISDTIKYWQTAIGECEKRAFKKLLVEQHFPVPLSTMDAFEATESVSKIQPTGIIIAFVDRDISQKETNLFVETVARNRGMSGKAFTNFAEGETWLKAQPGE